MEIVESCEDPFEAAKELVEASFNLWLENDERIDDITAIVVHLCHDDFAHDHAKAKAKWNVAKVKVEQVLENRPAKKFFNTVEAVVRKRADKDHHILDHLGPDFGPEVAKNGLLLSYDGLEEEVVVKTKNRREMSKTDV